MNYENLTDMFYKPVTKKDVEFCIETVGDLYEKLCAHKEEYGMEPTRYLSLGTEYLLSAYKHLNTYVEQVEEEINERKSRHSDYTTPWH